LYYIQGRQLTADDIELIRRLMAEHPDWHRSRLSIELCPFFEIARRTLLSVGIKLNIKTIRRLYLNMNEKTIEHRHRIALSDADGVENRTLFVCIDGGRLRERRTKRGRRPAGQKRQGTILTDGNRRRSSFNG